MPATDPERAGAHPIAIVPTGRDLQLLLDRAHDRGGIVILGPETHSHADVSASCCA
jgi:hypothetical protein